MLKAKSVKAHILRNTQLEGWDERIVKKWSYRQLSADPAWFHGWISFDAVTWNPYDRRLYCGLNSLDGDLLYAFDPTSETFEGLNTNSWTDPFDVKIHRTLLLNPHDKCFYFATSLLHDLDRQQEARGGKLVKFDPAGREYQVISVPVPRLYIQSIAADWQRGKIYGCTYPAEAVFQTDLKTRHSEVLAYIGNSLMFAQPHNPVVDNEGWLWGTCAETRAWDESNGQQPIRLFKYHPDEQQFVWFDFGLSRRDDPGQLLDDPPKPEGASSALAETRHKDDFGFCDSMVFDGERYIYAGTVAGVLCRIDTRTSRVEKIAHVMAAGRFPALGIKDGVLYGGGGMKGQTQVIRWDMRTDRIDGYTNLMDPVTQQAPARIHDLAVDDSHQIYLGENDNHSRSSFLWSLRLD